MRGGGGPLSFCSRGKLKWRYLWHSHSHEQACGKISMMLAVLEILQANLLWRTKSNVPNRREYWERPFCSWERLWEWYMNPQQTSYRQKVMSQRDITESTHHSPAAIPPPPSIDLPPAPCPPLLPAVAPFFPLLFTPSFAAVEKDGFANEDIADL